MESQEYNDALKRGEKAYREALSKGSYPYLQVLDEILSHVSIAATVSLGMTEIPADAIVGTVTAGRRTAFASNFMPLLGSNTEFATKWITLCKAHLSEGIHDPVKVYEYMNRYFVLEGNKRVSVLKYFGAPTIPAIVTRYVPKRSESPENRVYFEFLDFYAKCPANYLIFSKPGDYRVFTEAAGKGENEVWTEEERMNLKAMFSRFEQAFQSLPAGRSKEIPTGDAFLTYVTLYGYRESLSKLPEKMREEISKIQDELLLLKKDDRVKLLLETPEAPKPNVFERIFGAGSAKLKVAFIYNRTPESSAWTYGHELGRLSLDSLYGDEIRTVSYANVDPETMIDDTLET
ncbi:MAG: BMP family ABC transporter substrate-binding protein, partial [Lachnospiraceae bacterium]|nr:BMP family ABC transporter substrate-binding protein [Lachnospiraceae bacterium]